jgi:hypothetical protein
MRACAMLSVPPNRGARAEQGFAAEGHRGLTRTITRFCGEGGVCYRGALALLLPLCAREKLSQQGSWREDRFLDDKA